MTLAFPGKATFFDMKSLVCTRITNILRHAQKYALTGENSCSRNMLNLPPQFTPQMLQLANCGFDETVTMIGIPVPCLLPPLSEIIFSVLEEEEDFWKFLQCTSSERNMDDYDVFGIILSALVSK